jgi:hypothetical protein
MSTLKVDTIKSDTTPTVTISDGLSVTGVTTSTGDISIADKIIHTGDTNTAIRFPAADTITAETGGSERLRILTTGEVVIGNTASTFGSALLSIEKSSTTIGPRVNLYNGQASAADATCEIQVGQNYRESNKIIFGRENASNWQSSNASTASFTSFWTNSAGTSAERLRITSTGQVLIGSTSAGTSDTFLEVKNTAAHTEVNIISKNTHAALINLGDTDSYNQGRIKYDNSDNSLTFRTAATDRLSITSAGLVRVPDTGKFVCGDADDLQIHHTSSVNHIRSANGNVVIGTDANNMVILGAYYNAGGGGDTCEVWGGSNFLPATNDAIDLGETNHKWDDIYATNGTIQTSDQNNKDNIATSDLGLSFIDKLSPKSYKFKGKTRTHYGLIAQDVETVLSDISKATSDFAGFIKTDAPVQLYNERDEAQNRIPSGKAIGDVKLAAHTDYGLRYGEFIGPLIKAVQELSAKVTALESA